MITGSLSLPFPFSRPANFSRAFYFRVFFPLSESLEQTSRGGEKMAAVTFLQLFRDFAYWRLGSTVHFISE